MLTGVIVGSLVLMLFWLAAKHTTVRPNSKYSFAIESLVEIVLDIAEQNFGDRKKALKFLPLLLTLFTFILLSNLAGLIPGVGTINVASDDGVSPLLRPFTSDLNGTLALAILTIGTVQVAAIRERGFKKHILHYFMNNPLNPMNLFIGLIEIMGEFIRILTLSMRLFGVIYAGEVLLHVIGELSGNFGPIATLPVYMLEIFFSFIQAYVFMLLSTVYLAMATHHDEHHPESDHLPELTPLTSTQGGGAKV
jgi:F-type H+-transporting ATPase subunit a